MKYMSQLAAMVPRTMAAKQKVPKRIIILGMARWVMPKTTDVHRAKTSMALKWVSIQEAFLPLASECASMAVTMLSRPETTRNLVP